MGLPAQANIEVIDDASRAEIALHPIRRQLLAELEQPESASSLARKIGLTRQKVNYHLRELERGGFLHLVEERPRRNCIERIVQATARSYIVNPDVLGVLGDDPEEARSRFSASYLIASAAKMIRDVATLKKRASSVGKKLATLTMQSDVTFASAKDRYLFTEELTKEFARLVAKYHKDTAVGGRAYRFMLGAHPVITKSEEEARAEEAESVATHKERKDDR